MCGRPYSTVVERIWVWGTTAVVAVLIFAACSGGGGGDDGSAARASAAPGPSATVSTEDIDMTAADFPNINTLTKVHNHFVGNLLGHLDAALAVAHSPTGGVYPVGTLIQLVPQEAMVKRRAGWNAGTHDWEFFSLDVSPEGTKILTRGSSPVLNRFRQDCLSCHAKANAQWDLVCEKTHGCDPLPLDDEQIARLQQADPRPPS
jgi:hypothetical protein